MVFPESLRLGCVTARRLGHLHTWSDHNLPPVSFKCMHATPRSNPGNPDQQDKQALIFVISWPARILVMTSICLSGDFISQEEHMLAASPISDDRTAHSTW
ncbi:hypothetical protein H9L39_03316 [Fusarium oxysporum f. sp. albedinis]|nr:hypothetical protein H9L39_03316 [Fusarium oxysporum f. sp. albedinis]